MGCIDLHVHSSRSDGTLSPKELVDYAIKKGLKAMAITDHDTVDAIDEMLEYAKDKPIEIIPGIEYSTEYNKRDVHIVGLFIDHKAPVFVKYLENFKQSRVNRNYKLCANLQKAGIDIEYEKLLEMFPNAVITRAHYAKYLLNKGYVKSTNEAFDRYLGDHTPYFVHREKITPQEVIEVTLQAGGIPILAHPVLYGLGKEQLEILVCTLKKYGLMGIETIYSTYTPSDERHIKALAKKYNLLQSGGSDFHGSNKPGLDLATGYGRLYIDEEILNNMKKTLEQKNKNTKILFTDLDGTLLTNEKIISPKTRQMLLDMLEAGHHFVLASGRPLKSIQMVLEASGLLEDLMKIRENKMTGGIYITAYNGAIIYDCVEDKILQEYKVSLNIAQEMFDRSIKKNIHIHTYAENIIVSIAEDAELDFYRKNIVLPYIVETDLSKTVKESVYKLITIELEDKTRLEAFRNEIENSELGNELNCTFSNSKYLEFYSKRAGKGNALINLCNLLNVQISNSVAAGDEENDREMIMAAGVGAVMANGNEALKADADYVTRNDNNNDAIAEVIESFFMDNN